MSTNYPIPFTAFARFERLTAEKPLLYWRATRVGGSQSRHRRWRHCALYMGQKGRGQ